jgi:hypothetical protein
MPQFRHYGTFHNRTVHPSLGWMSSQYQAGIVNNGLIDTYLPT